MTKKEQSVDELLSIAVHALEKCGEEIQLRGSRSAELEREVERLRASELKAWGLVEGLLNTITTSGETPVFRRSVVVYNARAALAERKAGL